MAGTLAPGEIDKRLKEGWIRAHLLVEVLAVSKDTAESALEKHVGALGKEKRVHLIKKSFLDTRKLVNPHPNVAEGFSQVADIELLARDFDTLVYIAMNYAPSSIEILAPAKLSMDMGEAQGILASISAMIHRFAALGIGGVVVRT